MHLTRRIFMTAAVSSLAMPALANITENPIPRFTFVSADGGFLDTDDWKGRPVLVVNTASRCGFTGQFDNMQALYDEYRDRGLLVVATPSDDFNQELADIGEVKQFCQLNFGLDIPMTDIVHIKGEGAHPFYAWLRQNAAYEPRWNFNKVLIGADGRVRGTWGSLTKPDSSTIRDLIEVDLPM